MTNGNDKCRNCGGDRAIHHYQTDQCPVGGVEAPIGREQEWKTSAFAAASIPSDLPIRLAKDVTVREYFAAMAMQGIVATYGDNIHPDRNDAAKVSVDLADALIEALNASK